MDPVVRKDRAQVSALLANDFREFGSSGRIWTKGTIIDELATESDYTAPTVEDFTIQEIAPYAALATYRTVRPPDQADQQDISSKAALRSSLWIYKEDRWQMLFHQGTLVPGLTSAEDIER